MYQVPGRTKHKENNTQQQQQLVTKQCVVVLLTHSLWHPKENAAVSWKHKRYLLCCRKFLQSATSLCRCCAYILVCAFLTDSPIWYDLNRKIASVMPIEILQSTLCPTPTPIRIQRCEAGRGGGAGGALINLLHNGITRAYEMYYGFRTRMGGWITL